MSLCLLNSRSVRNKSAAFFDYICECKADLVAVTETWLSCCDDAIRVELCPDGYKLLDHVRDCHQGGSTALLFRDSLTVKKVVGGAKLSFEFSEWTVQLVSSYDLHLAIVYRPQSDSDDHRIPMTTFFNDLSVYLETVILVVFIVVDFNIHVDVLSNSDSTKFRDLPESFCLQQHVVGPTHIHGHTLDLIITRQSDQIVRSAPRVDCYFSECFIHRAFFLHQDSLL